MRSVSQVLGLVVRTRWIVRPGNVIWSHNWQNEVARLLDREFTTPSRGLAMEGELELPVLSEGRGGGSLPVGAILDAFETLEVHILGPNVLLSLVMGEWVSQARQTHGDRLSALEAGTPGRAIHVPVLRLTSSSAFLP